MPSSRASVRLLPNAVTVLALCSGLSAVNFALAGRFDLCVAAIAAAAVFDALDGGLARLLDASSKIGAELDSLSDLVAFGVSSLASGASSRCHCKNRCRWSITGYRALFW